MLRFAITGDRHHGNLCCDFRALRALRRRVAELGGTVDKRTQMWSCAQCGPKKPAAPKATRAAVLGILATCGPLTSAAVAEFFPGDTHRNVAAVISTLRRLSPKKVYISSWVKEVLLERMCSRAVYSVGSARDAMRHATFSAADRSRRKRLKQQAQRAPNSVWQWSEFV